MPAYVHGAVSLPSARIPWTRGYSDQCLMAVWFDLREAGDPVPAVLTSELQRRELIP